MEAKPGQPLLKAGDCIVEAGAPQLSPEMFCPVLYWQIDKLSLMGLPEDVCEVGSGDGDRSPNDLAV